MKIVFGSDMWRVFRYAECCTSVYDRGKYFGADSFVRIARRGVSQPRHMSVGRFRGRDLDCITTATPCYLPWTFIECETGDLLPNLHATRQTLDVLDAEGFDTSRMHLRYSGNKSFWVCIPAALMGHPLGSVADQKALRQRVFLPLMESRVDQNLWDGRHLHRLLGSTHEKAKGHPAGRVRILTETAIQTADAFAAALSLEARTNPLDFGRSCPDGLLLKRCKDKSEFHVPEFENVPRNTKSHGFMKRTEEGVSEGDRNFTAFRRACVELRRHGEDQAWQNLLDWSGRCDPPLPNRELQQCMRSAQRTIMH